MVGRTIDLNGRTLAVHNIAASHIRSERTSMFKWGIGIIVFGLLLLPGAAEDPSMFFATLLFAVVGALLVYYGKRHYVEIDLNSGRVMRIDGSQQVVEGAHNKVIEALREPETVLSTSLAEAADLVSRGLLSQQEWNSVKARVAGWPAPKSERLRHELEHLHQMARKGLLSESEVRDRKWDVISRMDNGQL